MKYYLDAFIKYVNYEERATREEFWMFVLCDIIVVFVIGLVAKFFDMNVLNDIYWWIALCPSIAVLVRRLHDTGRSGLYFFLLFIPVVGTIWLLVTLCEESQKGRNQWGPDPRER